MTWKEALAPIKQSEYFEKLWQRVGKMYAQQECFPPKKQIFRALELTPFESVKVVILGQDPYHGTGQANGLCFSVTDNVVAPPSLRNIFKELESDTGVVRSSKNLQGWAQQGVLLLNATLTVTAHQPNSHKDLGWETFTDYVIAQISEHKQGVVFVLWGAFAQKKEALINPQRHFVIKAPHPSPLSAHRGFFGSKPFSQINNYLAQQGQNIINWAL